MMAKGKSDDENHVSSTSSSVGSSTVCYVRYVSADHANETYETAGQTGAPWLSVMSLSGTSGYFAHARWRASSNVRPATHCESSLG